MGFVVVRWYIVMGWSLEAHIITSTTLILCMLINHPATIILPNSALYYVLQVYTYVVLNYVYS
ncbi:hypothetical protein HanPI659440_Chr14g0545781 [Helianthus annuus]|nr:hypothetical protein HanPI659440_Chr14g0545781 [Helianthus annuus]